MVACTDATAPHLRHRERPAPDFSKLATAGYIAMAESPNPMHRLWTERPWIKLALAHGCYWHRCAFCDTSLDYIRRYDPADAATIVGWMERAMSDTGLSGFHFIDEAAPPALLGNLSRLSSTAACASSGGPTSASKRNSTGSSRISWRVRAALP